jgi:hypothetical protein
MMFPACLTQKNLQVPFSAFTDPLELSKVSIKPLPNCLLQQKWTDLKSLNGAAEATWAKKPFDVLS